MAISNVRHSVPADSHFGISSPDFPFGVFLFPTLYRRNVHGINAGNIRPEKASLGHSGDIIGFDVRVVITLAVERGFPELYGLFRAPLEACHALFAVMMP